MSRNPGSGVRGSGFARVAYFVDPGDQSATIFRPGAAEVTLQSEAAVLDLSDVIPGFRCQLREIFS